MTEKLEEFKSQKIAMIVDGDNAQPSMLESMLEEAGKYGQVTIRRIFGDWTETNMHGWKEELHKNAFQPIQQFRYTKGKNATDNAMIIDAMDILHSNIVDGFCIVSSDSDYTRLATRIRESGIFIMGIGRKDTPKSFVNGCEIFTFVENLLPIESEPKVKQSNSKKKTPINNNIIPGVDDPTPLLLKAFDMAIDENGWATLANLGHFIRKLDPSFDVRTYKYKQLLSFIKSRNDLFEIKSADADANTIYVRIKQ
jgi:uncharacterized LabA/DUF88 family protein